MKCKHLCNIFLVALAFLDGDGDSKLAFFLDLAMWKEEEFTQIETLQIRCSFFGTVVWASLLRGWGVDGSLTVESQQCILVYYLSLKQFCNAGVSEVGERDFWIIFMGPGARAC